jgi:1,4-dihydroxy-2-naphthoate polyprenyltransferase
MGRCIRLHRLSSGANRALFDYSDASIRHLFSDVGGHLGRRHVKGDRLRGFWALADPKISLASMATMFLGASAASAVAPLHWGWLAATVIGIYAIEVAKNASGDIFDFDSGTDLAVSAAERSPFSGGKRVLVDRLLSRVQTKTIAGVGYIVATVIGLSIVTLREPSVFWLGLLGMACAYFYHAPPLKLSYRGLGELSVAACYGPLLCAGTFLVQNGSISLEVVLLSLPLGLLIAGFLLINEVPDYHADQTAGKRTLVVRIGRVNASRLFALVMAAALLFLIILPFLVTIPRSVWIGLVAAPSAIFAARRLLADPGDTESVVPAQAASLLTFVLYALGTGIGILVA